MSKPTNFNNTRLEKATIRWAMKDWHHLHGTENVVRIQLDTNRTRFSMFLTEEELAELIVLLSTRPPEPLGDELPTKLTYRRSIGK